MPRLFHNYHRFLARTDRCHLRWLLNSTMSTNGRQGKIDRGVQFQTEVEIIGYQLVVEEGRRETLKD